MKENSYQIDSQEASELLEKLLLYIGDPDPKIRDGLVYPVLAHLLHDKHLESDKLNNVFQRLLSPVFLRYDMGNEEQNSVLKRSFSVLQLAILLYVHRRDNVLDKDVLLPAIKTILNYVEEETVLEGYDQEVGWKHAVAHSADLLAQIVQLEEASKELLETVWNLCQRKFLNAEYLFVSDEDERMTTALVASLQRNLLTEEFILEWVKRFTEGKPPTTFPEIYTFKNNRKHLMQSLYFRIVEDAKWKQVASALQSAIISLEKRD